MPLTEQTQRDLQAVLETLDQRIHELSNERWTVERAHVQRLRTHAAEVLSTGT
jgi:hypothetical protein